MSEHWKAWFDGATVPNPGERGIGALLISPDGSERIEISEAIGFGTNNEAEYAALQAVLDTAIARGIERLVIRGDSQLVIKQVSGEWACKSPNLFGAVKAAKLALRQIPQVHLSWVPREENEAADALSGLALGRAGESAAEKRAWTNQKRIGEALGKSAIAIGKLLDQHGLRKDKLPTQKALEGGFARVQDNHFGQQVLWHQAKVIAAIGTDSYIAKSPLAGCPQKVLLKTVARCGTM